MPFLGAAFGDQQLSISSIPPAGCYFEVTLFPGYLNFKKIMEIAKSGSTSDKFIWGTLANLTLVSSTVGGAARGAGLAENKAGGGVLGGLIGLMTGMAGINPLDFRFNKISGLGSKIDTSTISVGGLNTEMIQLPNRVVHGNLILERGIFIGSPLTLELVVAMTMFKLISSEILVVLQSPDKIPLSAWLFRNTYPISWSNSDLASENSNIVMEKIEFAYTHFYPLPI